MLRSVMEKQKSIGLELLVTVSGLLSSNDLVRLAPMLWYRHLDDTATHVVAPVGVFEYPSSTSSEFDTDLFLGHAMCRETPR